MVELDLCGWHVSSAIPLPELPPWQGEAGAPDIVIALGDVPAAFDDTLFSTPVLQIDRSGRARYFIPGTAAYLVEGGDRITIAAEMAPDSPDVRLFLLGSVFGLLCHQRGVLPLHAASIEVDGQAIALAGVSGVGKSTLAAAFMRRGYPLLADDVTPVAFGADAIRFLPGLRSIRLWADSARFAEWREDELVRCREGLQKFTRAPADGFAAAPLAPSAIVHLRQVSPSAGSAHFQRLRGHAAARELRRNVYRWRSLVTLAGDNGAFTRTAEAAGGIPRHFIYWRPFDYARLDATVDAIVETVRLAQ
jgi:hypothetical protein